MSEPSKNTIEECLRSVWQRQQRKHATAGLLAFVSWFVPLFTVIIIIDRYAYLPGWFRALAAIALLIVALRQAWLRGWSRLQRFDAMQTALKIERSQPGMDSLLSTAVQFQQSGAAPGTSASMWELTLKKAQESVTDVAPDKVVSMRNLQRPLRIAGAIALFLLVGFIFNGSFFAAGLGRLFTPWLAIAYPTDTKIDLGSGELVIQEGSPATLEIKLSGEVPETAELELQTGEGRPRERELDVINGLSTYEIASASRNFSYRVKAGDARSEWRQVRVIPAPRLADVQVKLEYPEYIDRPVETMEALTITVPEGTKVTWELTLDTAIHNATLHRDGAEDQALQVGDNGRTLTLSETAEASRGYSFSWTEKEHGFDFESPRYFLQVASDQSPRVELVSPETNLNAMLGRPMELVVRANDDHGIGETLVIYRVNRRPEKVVTLESPVKSGHGEQAIDWDYRNDLPDLQIGDSVSFLVEVADKYPGEDGTHRMRTETRRITFLSREDYLAEINKQVERLLSRVRTLYRQQRAAHELVGTLDPEDDSFLPTCQLEAIRQEMAREQLVLTADEVQALLDDLAANQVSDAVEGDSLSSLRDALRSIATNQVAAAADLLRAQVGAEQRNPQPAIDAVNEAARELADLVMQRGIDASREVYARETQMLARELSRLRLLLMTAEQDEMDALAKRHEEVAQWTDDLLNELSSGMQYDERALAVLGLSRRIHALRVSKLTDSIREVGTLAGQGKRDEAARKLYPLIRPLLESEFTMRSGSEYALIRDLGERLDAIIAGQGKVMADLKSSQKAAEKLKERQADLRDDLVLAPLPAIPAPRPELSDVTFPKAPPSDELRLEAETLMTEALTHLNNEASDKALSTQREVLSKLTDLEVILNNWSVELAQKSLGVSAQVSDASERAGVLEQFETSQISLLERTEEAALDEKNPQALVDDQKALTEEVMAFKKSVMENEADDSLLPMIGRLEDTLEFMNLATKALSEKRAEEALEPQEEASLALFEARTAAEEVLAKYNLQQQLVGFQQSVSDASDGMADVVGGQNDLIAATKVADEEELQALLAPQRNLLQCLTDIAPSLDLVAARLDVGTPLVFAASDVEDALFAMEDGDAEDAAEIQEIAVESLDKVEGLVKEIAVQTGYVSETVEFLHEAQSKASLLSFQQRVLREDVAPDEKLKQQKALATETEEYGRTLTRVAGTINFENLDEKVKEKFEGLDLSLNFQTPARHMVEAVQLLQEGKDATDEMIAAEEALRTSFAQLNVIIEMLNGLPSAIVTSAEPPELHRLIAILDVASKQRVLLRKTHAADNEVLPSLAKDQEQLTEAIMEENNGELNHPLLTTAVEQAMPVAAALKSSRKEEACASQMEVDRTLRHFVIEQALILNTAIPPASASDSDVLTENETNDLYQTDTVGFVSDFVSGETPEDKESEWEILGTRNRAALNQNFARELPLEYRATLKNYYERVAK